MRRSRGARLFLLAGALSGCTLDSAAGVSRGRAPRP